MEELFFSASLTFQSSFHTPGIELFNVLPDHPASGETGGGPFNGLDVE
jgi:hypothetical protein